MGLESLTNRMSHLVRNEFRFGGPRSLESILEAYDRIGEGEVREVAEEVLDPARLSLVALGPSDPGALGFKTFERTVTVPGT
jgi:predicted Zn-dependent peptidase